MSTGVLATGVILLRIADPKFESGVLEDFGFAWIFLSIIDMLLVFFKDINSMLEVDDWYNSNLKIYKNKTKYLYLLEVVLQSKNQFNNNINVALLMDQMLYKFKEVNV